MNLGNWDEMGGINRLFFLSCFLFFTECIAAQSSAVFHSDTKDFGLIEEEGGEVKHTFLFVNKAQTGILIKSVQTTCGCTTPDWSSEVVNPADTGYVIASYNPMNRPGNFEKKLEISFKTVGGESFGKDLFIVGEVLPRSKSVLDELPIVIGGLRFKYRTLNVGKITTEEEVQKVFKTYNDSDSAIFWSLDDALMPNHISVSFSPDTLPPKTMGDIMLRYDPILKNDLGYVSDNLKLSTNEYNDANKEFHVVATITEYFSPLSDEQMKRAPKLVFDKAQQSSEEVLQGEEVVFSFVMFNTGLEPLDIRKIKTNCDCVTTSASGLEIASGESAQLDVYFDTSGRRGRQYKTITVFSNDPSAPTQMVSIKSTIKE